MLALIERLGLWPMRVLWFALPLVAAWGPAATVEGRTDDLGLAGEVLGWTVWFAGLVALGAPSTVSLTVLRTLAPLTIVGPLVLAVVAGTWPAALALTVGYGLVVTLVAFQPLVGDRMVNGSAYGPERRMALRTPAPLLLGPLQLLWLLTVSGLVVGPLLLGTGRLVVGGIVTVVGAVLARLGGPRLHQLSRRWVVFVPAGFVLHDHYTLAETLLMQRPGISSLGPVPLDKGQLLDLTAGSRGIALLVEFVEPTPLALRSTDEIQAITVDRLMFTPTLPGELLREARIRGIKVGVPA